MVVDATKATTNLQLCSRYQSHLYCCQYCQCFFSFQLVKFGDIFQPKTIGIPRAIIPQNFSSLGFAVLEELGNKQTHRLNHSLTSYCFSQMLNIYNIYIHPDHRKILIQAFSALIFLKCEKTYLYLILATQHNLCMYGREELDHFSL